MTKYTRVKETLTTPCIISYISNTEVHEIVYALKNNFFFKNTDNKKTNYVKVVKKILAIE